MTTDTAAESDKIAGQSTRSNNARAVDQQDSADDIKAYIVRLMATRSEPTPSQIQVVRDLLPPVAGDNS